MSAGPAWTRPPGTPGPETRACDTLPGVGRRCRRKRTCRARSSAGRVPVRTTATCACNNLHSVGSTSQHLRIGIANKPMQRTATAAGDGSVRLHPSAAKAIGCASGIRDKSTGGIVPCQYLPNP